jgi:hypothetical protein
MAECPICGERTQLVTFDWDYDIPNFVYPCCGHVLTDEQEKELMEDAISNGTELDDWGDYDPNNEKCEQLILERESSLARY